MKLLIEPPSLGEAQDAIDTSAFPEPGRTAAETACCAKCGRPLTGRKERFCTDKCRMQSHRATKREALLLRFQELESAVRLLRDELVPSTGGADAE